MDSVHQISERPASAGLFFARTPAPQGQGVSALQTEASSAPKVNHTAVTAITI